MSCDRLSRATEALAARVDAAHKGSNAVFVHSLSHCRYDWRTRTVTEIRDGVFYPTRFASPQGALIPLTPQESLVLYRPQTRRRQAHKSFSTQQLVLFELVRTG